MSKMGKLAQLIACQLERCIEYYLYSNRKLVIECAYINPQYFDKKGLINGNVQNNAWKRWLKRWLRKGLREGFDGWGSFNYIDNIYNLKIFSKLPCQMEKKMVYLYGCQFWVRKGKPRVIGGRKATGPKDNQVFIKRIAELPNTGKARLFYYLNEKNDEGRKR